MADTEFFTKELATYEREKSRLVAESEGKYALIRGDVVVSVWDTYEDALKAGYSQFGLEPFLVKRIQGIDQIYFFTRDFTVCPS
jgi:hypothetical protein